MYNIIAKYFSACVPAATRGGSRASLSVAPRSAVRAGSCPASRAEARAASPVFDPNFTPDAAYPGLSSAEARERLRRYGPNKLGRKDRPMLFSRVADAAVNPFTLILLALAGVSFAADFVFAAPDQRDLSTVLIIMTMLAVSALLRLVQEGRSSRAADRLRAMTPSRATVKRDGKEQSVPVEELVPGDLALLSAGDIIAADMRLVFAKDFFISQSGLTGESEPVEKFAARTVRASGDNMGDNTGGGNADNNADGGNTGMGSRGPDIHAPDMAFAGGAVVSGGARGVVTATGDNTAFGGIARSLSEKRPSTNFDKGINKTSWVFARFMMVMAPLVLFINGMTKGDWPEAALFALSVAVGVTPEILPVIVTANLGKGALSMARKKVVVKRLNAMQNFGAMDVLCTDKTGTLTMDKAELERHLNVRGENDVRALRLAFLNSRFQTGLRNPLDDAILRRARDYGMSDPGARPRVADEVPFDFNRRRMSVAIRDDAGAIRMITKGAIEEMLGVCSRAEYKGRVVPIDAALRAEILKTTGALNAEGMRVLGVARKTFAPGTRPENAPFTANDERDMTLAGYLAFLDPPKKSAAAAIRALREYGVEVKVLTGDNEEVTRGVCSRLGLDVSRIVTGPETDALTDAELGELVASAQIFARLSPANKARIVRALREQGRSVGFLGDGVNDVQAMREADVSVSVDSAAPIARETADIILLEKDLTVLEHGVIEGRKVFGNIMKYIKITASSNFGNILSLVAAAAFLPFLPMLPLQILFLNLIYEIACVSMPWDNVDADWLKRPRAWDASSIGRFMRWIGPTSSLFDVITFAALFFIVCPAACGGDFHSLDPAGQARFAAMFRAGWFVESLWTQTLVIQLLRTPRIPFLQSVAGLPVMIGSAAGLAVGTIPPFIPVGGSMGFAPLPANFLGLLAAALLGYALTCQILKSAYKRRFHEFI